MPEAYAKETIVLPLNNKAAFEQALVDYKDQIAVVAIEPIPANNGLLLQDLDFLTFLRQKTKEHGIMLLFDEVISGFRVGFEGAAGLYGIQPDVVCYGKIIGGGMPVGAFGASAEIMDHVAPVGPVYQAGTLSGNPVAMTAGWATLRECAKEGFYDNLHTKTARLVQAINTHADEHGYPLHVVHQGSIFWMAFSKEEHIRSAAQIDSGSMSHFARFHAAALERGVYFGPSGYEVGFVSAAHTVELIDEAAQRITDALDATFA